MSLKLVFARVATAGVSLVAAAATAANLQFIIQATNSYGSLSEFGDTTIAVGIDPNSPRYATFVCGSEGGSVQGRLIQLSAIVDVTASSGCYEAAVNVGPLAAG